MAWFWGAFCLILLIYLAFLIYDLKSYVSQLQFIVENNTNQELHLHTRMPFLKKITLLNNQVLRNKKETRTKLVTETQHLEQAIHNISHDLRTPLTVATGYVQHLLTENLTLDIQKDILTKIHANLEVVDTRLEHLLDYQRINENQVELYLEKINLSRCLEENLLTFYHSFEEKAFQLDIDIEKNLYLTADNHALNRIFQNILGNMLTHGHTHGKLVLKQVDDAILFIARNNTKESIQHPERLTERFYMEDLARQSEHSGIGLFIVQELTNRLSGMLSITTQSNNYEVTITFSQT
ncbi:sensor histidine kinase [Amphibacillus sp. Q70]|uniref:sensor histidine kinase n=1 Tax=Amphibacillus sp. Q70 TaxID=3453416 RepID=UPI003F831771